MQPFIPLLQIIDLSCLLLDLNVLPGELQALPKGPRLLEALIVGFEACNFNNCLQKIFLYFALSTWSRLHHARAVSCRALFSGLDLAGLPVGDLDGFLCMAVQLAVLLAKRGAGFRWPVDTVVPLEVRPAGIGTEGGWLVEGGMDGGTAVYGGLFASGMNGAGEVSLANYVLVVALDASMFPYRLRLGTWGLESRDPASLKRAFTDSQASELLQDPAPIAVLWVVV